jgi:hypothetical protein
MRLEAFEVATGKSLAGFQPTGSKGLIMSMFFSADGQWLVAGGGGGQNGIGFGGICLWRYRERDKNNKPLPPSFHKSVSVLREILPGLDGTSLVALGTQRELHAGRIEVWDLHGAAPALPMKK